METVISERKELLELLNQNKEIDSTCDHTKYLGWANGDPAQTDYFKKIGEVRNPINWGNQTNYWGEKAPVELEKYPYWMCEIQKCEKCGKLFFHYPEDGGHGRQLRFRLIRPELLIDTTINKYMNLAIPYGLEDFFKTLLEELDVSKTYERSWEGLWEAFKNSTSLPLIFTLYNYDVFVTNYKDEAKRLIDISERFNKLDRNEKIIIKAGNM